MFKNSIIPLLLYLNYPKPVKIIGCHRYLFGDARMSSPAEAQQVCISPRKGHTLTVPTYLSYNCNKGKYFFWVQNYGITTIKCRLHSIAFKSAYLFEDISAQIVSKLQKIWTEKICSWRNWQEGTRFCIQIISLDLKMDKHYKMWVTTLNASEHKKCPFSA